MRRTVIRSTLAEGLVCIDTVACARRKQRSWQLELFGAEDPPRLERD